METFRMKRLAGVAAAALAALALGACGGSDGGKATTDASGVTHKPVTLKLMWWQDSREGAFKTLLDGFHRKYPWITVQPESVPYDAYYQKVGAYVSTDSGPDVMALEEGGHWLPYKDALRPLDASVARLTNEITTPELFCADYDCSKGVYGIGYARQGHVLYYNKDILRAAGLDPENPPTTFAEMTTACQKIRAIGKACWAVGGKDLGLPLVMGAEAVKILSEREMLDLAAGRMKWTDPKVVELLTVMDQIGRNGWYQDGYLADGFGAQEPSVFESGKTAFALGLISDAINWNEFGSIMGYDKIGAVGFPDLGDGSPAGVTPGPLNGTIGVALNVGYTIPKWSKHPQEAELFMAYAVDPAVQKAMLQQPRGPFPALKDADASWQPQPIFGQLLEMAGKTRAGSLLAYIGNGYMPQLNAELQSLSEGKTTPQAAAAAIEKAAEQTRR